jgi:hypothetical protein
MSLIKERLVLLTLVSWQLQFIAYEVTYLVKWICFLHLLAAMYMKIAHCIIGML